ncbi:MAG TPA: M28 family metallopeptidase [Thermoanaerobaculia bacterium]|nr:M28 family metallopeptidase [Thermoanaerobaculia bacterium]
MPRLSRLAALLLAAPAFAVALPAQEPSPIPGFSATGSARQHAIEAGIVPRLDNERTERHFRYLTEEPHPPGSERNYELALYHRDRFVEYGLEDVTLHRYDVLLPLPREVSVTMLEPREYRPTLREDGYAEDKDSFAAEVGPTYMSMSGSGDVTGQLVYAHSGNPADYDWLEAQGIDLRGKIALVRYSVPYSYRGFKAWEAERRGLAAMLIYSDPQEDGYRKGEVFPDGPWGPESHIQRGAISYDFIVPGDPLTPGWASVEGARRIPASEARTIPKIPAVPMSWRDAKPLLEALDGPVAPWAWQGGLPITYRVGPGPAKLRVVVDMDEETRPIWVVTGRVRGSDRPDQTVVLGNHRDAWVYGGVDPSSGSATLIETARVLGELARAGHRPRRSVVLASWDAEEVHLTGSTEWGEEFANELGAGAVAYLNVDSSTSGSEFAVSAVASLNPTIEAMTADVIDPNTRLPLRDVWRRANERASAAPDARMVENRLGSGSDYTVFLNFLGIPIVDMIFDGPYGVYHSQYDSYYWVSRFGDPGFRYMTAMVEVWLRLALRLANAEALPYDFAGYAELVAGFVDELEALPGATRLDLATTRAALSRLRENAQRATAALERAVERGPVSAELDRELIALERAFLLEEGIPDRPWFKHALYAPRYTYAAMSLPGVTEAVERGDAELARDQLRLLVERLEAVATGLERIAAGAGAQP